MPHNVGMGKHAGGRPAPPPRRELGLLTAGAAVTIVAWVVLVTYAIRFGALARSGRSAAWLLLTVATVGAICCLFLALVLGTRVVGLMRAESGPAPVRAAGGRRARR